MVPIWLFRVSVYADRGGLGFCNTCCDLHEVYQADVWVHSIIANEPAAPGASPRDRQRAPRLSWGMWSQSRNWNGCTSPAAYFWKDLECFSSWSDSEASPCWGGDWK